MNKRVIAVVAAGVLALAGVALLLVWAKGAETRAYEGAELTQVVRVEKKVPAGTSAADLAQSTSVVEVPASTVPEGAVRNLAEVTGTETTAALEPGEVLLESRLGEPGASRADLEGVPEGLQAITVSLETQQLVGGDLEAGDTVGVIAGYINPEETVMIQDDVLVLGITGVSVDEAASGAATIKLAVTEDVAKKIANAGLFGKLWLTKQNETTKHTDGVVGREDVTK